MAGLSEAVLGLFLRLPAAPGRAPVAALALGSGSCRCGEPGFPCQREEFEQLWQPAIRFHS